MSLEIKIHDAQTSILRELLFHPSAGYAVLQKSTGLTSDHFNFHIGRLIGLDLVEKVERGMYKLSTKGKEYANRLDTDNNTVERQPKAAVLMALEKVDTSGESKFVFQERLKNPYFGFWGFPTGKMRWGETIIEAAEREALEETGLAADWRIAGLYHEIVIHEESSEMVEDKLFFVVHGTNVRGGLVADFEGGHNEWLSREVANDKDKIFDSFRIELDILTSTDWVVERTTTYNDKAF
jgi:8-oxo-dGTP pyrophosphatase MutT (NUDIX family)